MLRYEREEEILAILRTNKRVRVEELGKLLYSSQSSIRRDLTALEKKGLVRRYYGGVELVQSGTAITTFAARTHQNVAAKRIMAKKAAQLVKEGDIVFLDQSSSSLYVAQALAELGGVTVVTSSVEILCLLSQSTLEVRCCGGSLSRDNRNCILGDDAVETFSGIHADLMFFATKALSSEGVIFDCTRQEVCLRNAMMKNTEKTVYLCDSGKFGTVAGYRQCDLGAIDVLISEKAVPEALTGAFPKLTVL